MNVSVINLESSVRVLDSLDKGDGFTIAGKDKGIMYIRTLINTKSFSKKRGPSCSALNLKSGYVTDLPRDLLVIPFDVSVIMDERA